MASCVRKSDGKMLTLAFHKTNEYPLFMDSERIKGKSELGSIWNQGAERQNEY